MLFLKKFLLVSCLWGSIQRTYGSNILVILPSLLRSHANLFSALIDALAEDHSVTFASVLPRGKSHKNVTEFRLEFHDPITDRVNGIKAFFDLVVQNPPHAQMKIYYEYFKTPKYYTTMFNVPQMQKILKEPQKFDAMIVLSVGGEMFSGLSHLLKIPLIQLTTGLAMPWNIRTAGNDVNLASDISFFSPETPNTFMERLQKFVNQASLWYYYENNYMVAIEKEALEIYPPGTPTVKEMLSHTSVFFVNSISAMGHARSQVPNVVELGGLHCRPARPLPPDLEEFMQSSGEEGVIYFSLGSTLHDESFPMEMRVSIRKILGRLKQKVLWKWEGAMQDLPSNVKISGWLPQQDILGHNKTRLFISQAGMLSLQEAAYHGVQVLLLPILTDQFTNAKTAENQGYGLAENWKEFSEERFYQKLKTMLTDDKYSKRMKEISYMIKDDMNSPKDRLKWWVSYAIRHNGTHLLKPQNKHLPLTALMALDIYAFLLSAFLLIVFISVYAIYYVKRQYTFWKSNKDKHELYVNYMLLILEFVLVVQYLYCYLLVGRDTRRSERKINKGL